jgi:nicotinamidase-related amidase
MKLALMIIDMQKAYYEGQSKISMDAAVEYINAAVEMFRESKLPIIWVQDKSDAEPGQPGFDLIDSLQPKNEEYKVQKLYGNSFNKTDCLDIVKKENVDTLLITGYCAEYCVLSTYRGALDHDLTPILFRGALASGKEENIGFVESVSSIMSYSVLKKILESYKSK